MDLGCRKNTSSLIQNHAWNKQTFPDNWQCCFSAAWLLIEPSCEMPVTTGWQLRTEEVMTLLNAGSRFLLMLIQLSCILLHVKLGICGSAPGPCLRLDHSAVQKRSGSVESRFNATLVLWCWLYVACGSHRLTGTWSGACQYKVG